MYMNLQAAQYCLAGRIRPVGRRLESPGLEYKQLLKLCQYVLSQNLLSISTTIQVLIKLLASAKLWQGAEMGLISVFVIDFFLSKLTHQK